MRRRQNYSSADTKVDVILSRCVFNPDQLFSSLTFDI